MIKNEYDEIYWHKKEVISFHIIYHLCKYLGFDPLTFTPLPDEIFFPKNEIKFFRFHFLALPFRKMSSHVRDIILTSDSLVSLYNSTFQKMNPRVAEAFFQGIIDSLADLTSLKDDRGNLLDINEDSIVKTLENYFGSSMYDALYYWKRQDNIKDSMEMFNNRRLIVKNQGFEQFLVEHFQNAYDNHFKQVRGIKLTQALAIQEDVDLLNEIYDRKKFKLE